MIVPTRSKGMPQRTLRVRLWKGRGASRAAFPRRAWERSIPSPQGFDSAATLRHSARPLTRPSVHIRRPTPGGLILSGGVFSPAVFFEVVK
ncbi:hypothetical protein DMX03_26005 [Pseudomonas koreensis]|nr:hypothetical protein DMX03_26005 [Pseudomonas koreensis]